MNELIKAADQVVNWWKESGMHIVGGAPACMFKLREELEKIVPPHRSDCAVHNAPAMPIGQCDCGSMTEDDFSLVSEDPDRVREIAIAAIEAHCRGGAK